MKLTAQEMLIIEKLRELNAWRGMKRNGDKEKILVGTIRQLSSEMTDEQMNRIEREVYE